jgi:membrane protein DedA with SNARE-associated domain
VTPLSSAAGLAAIGPSWLDPQNLETLGDVAPWVAAAIVFAECGLLVGFFLPGDTLLFTLGLLVGTGVVDMPIWVVCSLLAVAALLGNVVGYEIGRAAGPAIFRRPESALFKHENVEKAAAFFERWGAPAITLARFVPIVRTFITVIAGVARMDRRRYLAYSTVGALIWAAGVTALGYFLGSIAFVRENVDVIFAIVEVVLVAVVLLSVAPVLLDALRRRRRRSRAGAEAASAQESAAAESAAESAAEAVASGQAARPSAGRHAASPDR